MSADKVEQIYPWKFQRLGGLDQVVLQSSEDFCRLGELDPKLWVALACPAGGLEFDDRTLELIDTDQDGRIRVPEIVEAVSWTCSRLKDPSGLVSCSDALPLDAIDDESPQGKRLLATARAVLASSGKADAVSLGPEDVSNAAEKSVKNTLNGDGIIPPNDDLDEDLRSFIYDAMAVTGSVKDAGGQNGINKEIAQAFVQTLTDWSHWRQNVKGASDPLGADTSEAWELITTLKGKLDDYFLRGELAAYAPQAQKALNADEETIAPIRNGILDGEILESLPLSQVGPDKPLNLMAGLNPSWREPLERLRDLVKPLLPKPDEMTRADWVAVQDRFSGYRAALDQRPEPVRVKVAVEPTARPEKLGDARIKQMLESGVAEKFRQLADKDLSIPAAGEDIRDVERLVLYHQHLYRLLMNFVSFDDFYSMDRRAAFQAGSLYLDGRQCKLCLWVEDMKLHPGLSAFSSLYLVYCDCRRKKEDGSGEEEKRSIVAAMTAGDSDLLLENRNGVFVDNDGQDWDATIIKIISNPISLWQALWSPYKRFGKMITEQVNKFAGAKDENLVASASQTYTQITQNQATQNAAQKFDIGRNVGIFAALGLGLGALGTALASIARALFALSWWQFPLVLLGLFLFISGPSLVLAWLKLRKRTLGPVLEASGWAVNGEVKINYALGRKLTSKAELPDNASRSYADPFGDRKRWRLAAFITALVMGCLLVLGWRWWHADGRDSVERLINATEQKAQQLGNATAPPPVQTGNATVAPTVPQAGEAPAATPNP